MQESIIGVIVPVKGCVVMKWQVSLNNDSFDRAGITKDCQDAVCEYIWKVTEELGMSNGELRSKPKVTALTQKLLALKAQ